MPIGLPYSTYQLFRDDRARANLHCTVEAKVPLQDTLSKRTAIWSTIPQSRADSVIKTRCRLNNTLTYRAVVKRHLNI